MIKLEKIVNKSLHLDTDSEIGRKIQELIDMHQNNQISTNAAEISSNKEEIEKLKNGK
jgi:hypothetical protein